MNRLLDDIDVLETLGDPSAIEVLDVRHDSRQVQPGDLFCCLPGLLDDGHAFAAQAVDRGAVGLVCEHLLEGLDVAQARVNPGDIRPAMARLAAAVHGYPARDLVMVGVTGTNGKTTVTHLLGSALDTTAVIGTLSGARTTPESTDLQRQLHQIRDTAGPGTAVAMEVSSHALAQSRVDAITFDVALFTNLSHDHLDFHGSMEAYFAAKASLFVPARTHLGVVNADDGWGERLLGRATVPCIAVRRSDVSAIELAPGRTSFTWRGQRISLAMSGMVNVDNALLAAEAAHALGHDADEVAERLSAARAVPGRLEVVAAPPEHPFTVLVDYAHTPTGLVVVLAEARRLAGSAGRSGAGGRVLTVFGCGGDRDRAKRPLMGEAAASLADVAILTSDNPRHEDPLAIIDEVRSGDPEDRLVVEPDRRAAIALALLQARPGDVVVLAGKGHETTQQFGDTVVDFDDRAVAAELLSDLKLPGGR